jgi:tetratricopeptide (TPR) repeat protein
MMIDAIPERTQPTAGFWRKELADFALDQDSARLIAEQKAWIAAEPGNPRPYYHLAMFYRMQHKRDEALGLLLHAVGLDEGLAPAHTALSEMYAASGEMDRARHHAQRAEALGEAGAMEQLRRYGVG